MAMKSDSEVNPVNGCLNSTQKTLTVIQYANAVPSQPGYNQCEYCNITGPSESFFSSSKRFCSCVCSRSFSSSMRDHGNSSKNNERRRLLLAQHIKRRAEQLEMEKERYDAINKLFDWGEYIDREKARTAPVALFPHCSLSDVLHDMFESVKVEIINRDICDPSTVYWIANIVDVAGYFAKVRHEGYDDDCSKDFWLHVFNDEMYPLAWCYYNKKELVIPEGLKNKSIDWKNYLLPRLSACFTLPDNFERLKEVEKVFTGPLVAGLRVEVVDKSNPSRMRVAVIKENRGGRLFLKYEDHLDYFWCHSFSDVIHHVGWSCMVGHDIEASPEYKRDVVRKIKSSKFDDDDATPELFEEVAVLRRKRLPEHYRIYGRESENLQKNSTTKADQLKFAHGMKLEVVDPSNPSCICAATVVKILRDDFVMVKKDSVLSFDQGSHSQDLFCCHTKSAYILPPGFCLANELELVPPRGYTRVFDWKEYTEATGSVVAPISLFNEVALTSHNGPKKDSFQVGMKIEAANKLNPRQICVATVMSIRGRLMKVRLESCDDYSEQWMDIFSPDVYPVGWCQAYGHPLEAPRPKMTPLLHHKTIKKTKKISLSKGNRKRKRMKMINRGDDDDTSGQEDGNFSNSLREGGDYDKAESGKDFLSESSPTYSPYGFGYDAKPPVQEKSSDESDTDVKCKLSSPQGSSEAERKNAASQLSDEKFESQVSAFLSDGLASVSASKENVVVTAGSNKTTFTSLKINLDEGNR